MPLEYPIAGTMIIKVPPKFIFIDPNTDKVSAKKSLNKGGIPAKNSIKFEVDDTISEIVISNAGKKASNSTKSKKELGSYLDSEVKKYEKMGKKAISEKK